MVAQASEALGWLEWADRVRTEYVEKRMRVGNIMVVELMRATDDLAWRMRLRSISDEGVRGRRQSMVATTELGFWCGVVVTGLLVS